MEVQRYGIMRKPNPPPFLVKTYLLVEDPSTDDVVSWNAEGSGFVVWQPAEFARDLLPTLFKHSNFSSFIRQLNTYGFRKVATSRWEFCNDLFKKGKRELLCQIRRRKAWANRPNPPASPPNEATTTMSEVDTERKSCSSSSSSEHMIIRSNLADENKRLKRENGTLTSELSYMKSKCKELHDLVALYSRSSVPAGKEEKIDEDDDKRPKLFGVRLEVMSEDEEKKRKRSSGNCHQVFDETSATTSTSTSARFNSINLSQSCKYGLY